MEDYLAASAAPRRFNLLLVAMFGGAALLLAVVGVYGVISYSVTRRTREFGVRMALGAQKQDVLAVVMAQAGKLVGAGIVLGLVGALAATRLLTDLLFHVRPTDVTTYVCVVAVVAATGLLACCVPAWRAAKVDPSVALRHE
jgi:putative ABC transport system permease protein